MFNVLRHFISLRSHVFRYFFAWSSTTGSMTLELEELRKGLYGVGAFSFLQDEFSVQNFKPWTRQVLADIVDGEALEGKEDEVLLDGACAGLALSWLWGPAALNEWGPNRCSISSDLSSMGGLFGGTFSAPNLLADKDGIATPKYPADNDERWEMNVSTGELKYGSTDVSFWCALPQELDTSCSEGNPEGVPFASLFRPFFLPHGYGSSRAEIPSRRKTHDDGLCDVFFGFLWTWSKRLARRCRSGFNPLLAHLSSIRMPFLKWLLCLLRVEIET